MLNLWLTDLPRLVHQQAPGICLSVSPVLGLQMQTTALHFHMFARDQTQVLMLTQQTTEPFPQLLAPFLMAVTSGIKWNEVDT